MSSNSSPITVRTDDDILKAKLQRLARIHGRSLSKEAEQVLKRYVQRYEEIYGEIKYKR
jgi:predicted transcriptional regulator